MTKLQKEKEKNNCFILSIIAIFAIFKTIKN